MPSIAQLIDEIRALNDEDVSSAADVSPLAPVLHRLGSRPTRELDEYLRRCVPQFPMGRLVEFHDLEALIDEHTALEPGLALIDQGFLCIAKEGDGSQFAIEVATGRVFHLEVHGDDADQTREEAWNEWASLRDFLIWCRDAVAALVADETGS